MGWRTVYNACKQWQDQQKESCNTKCILDLLKGKCAETLIHTLRYVIEEVWHEDGKPYPPSGGDREAPTCTITPRS